MLARTAVVLAAAAGFVSAQLQVLVPGGPNLWWVANSENNIIWNCKESQVQDFTVLLSNSDPKVLTSAEAIVAIQQNYVCSQTLTTQQANFSVAQNYKVQFANPLNASDVYAESDFFEVKPAGSTYPASSATPTAGASSTSGSGSGSGSATASGGGASASGKSSGAAPVSAPALGALLAGAVAALAL
ncbi:hypothetical protein DFH11DRAFT_1506826 [Phellopilus nigrolimitatus]|nr:hypothetical protein DFH11DRAFT_1506826 [Phellopilus nigrolimitatus]